MFCACNARSMAVNWWPMFGDFCSDSADRSCAQQACRGVVLDFAKRALAAVWACFAPSFVNDLTCFDVFPCPLYRTLPRLPLLCSGAGVCARLSVFRAAILGGGAVALRWANAGRMCWGCAWGWDSNHTRRFEFPDKMVCGSFVLRSHTRLLLARFGFVSLRI